MAFKDFFIKKEEVVPPPVKKAPATQVAVMTIGGDNSASSISTIPVQQGNVDYNKTLDDLIASSSNKMGYVSFMSAINKMSKVALPEKAKYETTFMAFGSMGVTVDSLEKDGEQIIENLNKVKETFEMDLEKTRAAEVTAREQQAAQLQEQIIELNRQVEEKSVQVNMLLSQKEDAARQLQIEDTNFHNALASKLALINENVNKIKTHLNATTE